MEKHDTDSVDRPAPTAVIEVTPEMIEAGYPYLCSFDPNHWPDYGTVLRDLFSAMWHARPGAWDSPVLPGAKVGKEKRSGSRNGPA